MVLFEKSSFIYLKDKDIDDKRKDKGIFSTTNIKTNIKTTDNYIQTRKDKT